MDNNDKSGDYVFRFELNAKPEGTLYDDPLVEFVRSQLEDLLNFLVLTKDGEEVKVNGFKLLDDRGNEYRIFRENPIKLLEKA